MSDREKLIEIIIRTPCVAVSSRIAAEHIVDHLISNGVTVQKWIPVSERLPPAEEEVLVCDEYEDCWIDFFKITKAGNVRWLNAYFHGEPRYWMPLPEPPKECE